MWLSILGWIVPLVIHFGMAWVLAKYPNLPPWLITILTDLEGAKAAAMTLPQPDQKAALGVAKAAAIASVYKQCSGVACPSDLKDTP